MFRHSLFLKFGILGLMAIGLAGGVLLSTEPSRRSGLDLAGTMDRVEPSALVWINVKSPLREVESSVAKAESPLVKTENPLTRAETLLAIIPAEPGCECQGECGFAEQMRQSEH
jgi:hypothetical protein